MISKNTIKLIKSLNDKKCRQKEMLFVVEGDKSVNEMLNSRFELIHLYACENFVDNLPSTNLKENKTTIVNHNEIKKLSQLQNPQNSIAILKLPEPTEIPTTLDNSLTLYLDGIQDPGNMGTILRICDWFGVDYLFCSPDTVDIYNPKVIQASMGSFCRVHVIQTKFSSFAEIASFNAISLYGAFLNGTSIYSEEFPSKMALILGNEGNGIRTENEKYITRKISIPSFSVNEYKPESLNVAVATGIICSEIKKRRQ